MRFGIEFKRKRVYDEEWGREIWFWRIAPYCTGVDPVKATGFFVFVGGMTILFLMGG